MSDECPICFELFDDKMIVTTPCKHTMCLKCLAKLQVLRCPLCRLNLSKYMPSYPNLRGDVRLVAMHVDTNSSSMSTLTVRPIPITMPVSPPRTPALPSLPRRIGRFRTSAFQTVPQDDNLDA